MPVLNVNVGLLGHVDSGKTALAKALSQTASTAAFDKSPQSQERGITLDLGFSACEVTSSTSCECRCLLENAHLDKVLLTFVDCPGHASLIRTIVGGAQIIDVMVLVIDATKGVQAQTAECLVLGEILAKPMVIVVNKIDAMQCTSETSKKEILDKLEKKLRLTFYKTRWPRVTIVNVAAAPAASENNTPINTSNVIPAILSCLDLHKMLVERQRDKDSREDFVMLVDHCFALRGQGTVFTGTVLRGCVHVNDNVLIPEQQLVRKVKSLQIFKQPVTFAQRGDRIGLGVTQFDHTLMERGIICSAVTNSKLTGSNTISGTTTKNAKNKDNMQKSNTINNNNNNRKENISINNDNIKQQQENNNNNTVRRNDTTTTATNTTNSALLAHGVSAANISEANIITTPRHMESVMTLVAEVARVRFYTLPCDSHTKFHVTLGHSTVMCNLRYFRRPNVTHRTWEDEHDEFQWNVESKYMEELSQEANMCFSPCRNSQSTHQCAGAPVSICANTFTYYAIITLERPLWASVGATLIAMRLDLEKENVCRIALAGKVCALITSKEDNVDASATRDGIVVAIWRRWPIIRLRERELRIDRVIDSQTCIAFGVISVTAEGNSGSKVVNSTQAIKSKEDLFAEIQKFVGLKVQFVLSPDDNVENMNDNLKYSKANTDSNDINTGVINGTIKSTFGHTGKVKLHFDQPVFVAVNQSNKRRVKRKDQIRGQGTDTTIDNHDERLLYRGRIMMTLKKYPLAAHSTIVQEKR